MITSQVARSATYSARTAWEFAKLPFRLRETALLAALIDLSQETPSDPAPPGHLPQGGEASPASKEHKVRQRARAKRALGGKGVLVPSGHRPGSTEPAGETGVDESSLASLDLLGQKALADFLRTSDPRSRLANSPKTLCNLVWAAVSEVPLVKPGGAWYNKIPGGKVRPEIGGCKGLDGEGGPW